jgi:hypothetical protein
MRSNQHRQPCFSKLSVAIAATLLTTTTLPLLAQTEQQEEEDKVIEEVVTTGTRLKGSAQAVLQERQNQAFVADILGADQISRTGDSDAASALRRVTGLTLVDGKFIYVRGLGERYSSTQLNGQGVPSPDPTRSVVPLDLFPSSVIESLSVQKSFSPDMPAHFGGGNVNIRTKSIPTEFVFRVQGSIGSNTNNSDDGFFYDGGSTDFSGRDDGTRALPSVIRNSLASAQSGAGVEGSNAFPVTLEDRQEFLQALNFDIGPDVKSIDPNTGVGATLGNVYKLKGDSKIGFLSTFAYNQNWTVRDEVNGNNQGSVGCSQLPDELVNEEGRCFGQTLEGVTTERNVTWSGLLNLGYEFNKNHKIELTNVLLHDSRDRVRVRDFIDVNETEFGEREFNRVDILFEERRMNSNQIKGTHNFPQLYNAYFDWYGGTARARRQAPGGLDITFQDNIENGVVVSQQLQDVSATNAILQFQELRDVVETTGWNAGIPIFGNGYELEFKIGASFFEKVRDADNVQLEIPHRAISDEFTFGGRIDEIFSDENISNPDFFDSSTGQGIFQSQTADGDRFVAATKIDAFYFLTDAFIANKWRITGGFRFERFQQLSIPFAANTNQFSVTTEEIEQLIFEEDEFFPSLALTYTINEQQQFRFNYSQTTVRPDLRDISTTFFIDPLTEFLVRGTPLLQSSSLDNFDARWEWYLSGGNNFSVALFYKDIDTPIELIELGTVGGAAPNLLTANGESGELSGIEAEFLHDLGFISDKLSNFFITGNVTFSDSEVVLGAVDDDEISLFETQLLDALDATSASNIVTNNVRRLVGHSEWVANLQLGFDSLNGEHSATLVYNAFGPRIIIPGARGNEDAEEETFNSLDLVYSYFPNFASSIKVSIRNILDERKQITQNNLDVLRENTGINFGVSYTWDF